MKETRRTSLKKSNEKESNTNIVIILAVLVVVPFVMYWQTTGFDLVWDDTTTHLTANPYLNPISFDNLLHFWKEQYCGMYIPVVYNLWTVLTAIGASISSTPYNPFVYHLANVLLHTLNGILVFLLLRRFITNPWAALAGALLFLAHPLQVESVAWVSEFRGLVAAFFGFTALLLYIKSCSTKYGNTDFKLLGLYSSICFLLALLSKPSVAVLPLFAVLMEYYLYRPSLKQLYSRPWLWLWIVLAAVIVIVTSLLPGQEREVVQSIALWDRPLIWVDAVTFYLYKLTIPLSLAASYARTPEYVMGQWWFYLIWMVPVGIGFCLWYVRERVPGLVLAALLFLLGFLPVSGLVEFVFQDWSTVADRYLYLSMLGVSLGFGYMADRVRQHWQWVIFGGVVVLLGTRSFVVQVPVWENGLTLWSHCIEIMPFESRAYNNLGKALQEQGRTEEAIEHYLQALQLKPDHVKARNNLGVALKEQGRIEEAIEHYLQALQLKPDYAEAHNNLGNALGSQGRTEEAIERYLQALRLKPDYVAAHYNLGNALANQGRLEEAIEHYLQALLLKPDHVRARNNLGNVLGIQGRLEEAIEHYLQALRLKPDYAEAHNNLGVTLKEQGRIEEAIKHYLQALRLKPDYAEAHNNLGTALVSKGHIKEAIELFREALRVNPDHVNAKYNLDKALLMQPQK